MTNRQEIEKKIDEASFTETVGFYDEREEMLSKESIKSFFFDEILPDILRDLQPDIIYENKLYKEKAKEKYNITL